MPHPCWERCPEARLIRIELPRVNVEHRGLTLEAVEAADGPPGAAIGEQTEVPAAHGQRQRGETRRRAWELKQPAGRPIDAVRDTRCRRDAVPVVPDREDAGVVLPIPISPMINRSAPAVISS